MSKRVKDLQKKFKIKITDESFLEQLNEGYEDYIKAIKGLDQIISILLSCHLLIERYLEEIIILHTNESSKPMIKRLSFYDKTEVIKDLAPCFSPKLLAGIRKINTIRNKCAHESNHEITKDDFIDLCKLTFEDHQEIIAAAKRENLDIPSTIMAEVFVRINSYVILVKRGHFTGPQKI